MGGKDGLDLNTPQILGSALAAVTAAAASSFLGVTGTIVGAAVASAATTVGNAVYTHYLHRTRDRLKQAHAVVTGREEEQAFGERAPEGEEGLAAAVHATVRDHGPADLSPRVGDAVPLNPGTAETPRLRREGSRRPLWLTVIVATVATFALSMSVIVGFELVSGKPLAATVHGEAGSGTSLGGTVYDSNTPAPTQAPTTDETPATKRSTAPKETPEPSSPTGDPGSGPSSRPSSTTSQAPRPTTGESGRPSAPAGTDAPGTDSGPGDGQGTESGGGTGNTGETGDGEGTGDAERTGGGGPTGAGVQPSTTSR